MQPQDRLNRSYENAAIYTSGFYADPADNLSTHEKLFDNLKSFVMNQHADTPFSLQIMTTNSEINIMPLGLIDLNELKDYEDKLRLKHGLNYHNEDIPLIVQFSPHTKEAKVIKKMVGTTQDLFQDFNQAFPKIWATVKEYLAQNEKILDRLEENLVSDSQDVRTEFQHNFSKMSAAKRKEALGFSLADKEITHFATYMADMHEVEAIVLSAASFAQHELLGQNKFSEMMQNNVRRSTLFWVLDNTFYEIFYYFIKNYAPSKNRLQKYLFHHKETLIVNMRTDAFQRAQKLDKREDEKVDFNKYFTDIFIPVAQQLATEIDRFKN